MNLRYPAFLILFLILFLAACANTPPDDQLRPTADQASAMRPSPSAVSTAVPEATLTAAPTATVTAVVTAASEAATAPPTLTSLPLPTATEEAPLVTSGQTAEGAFFLGDPAAPLTIIDYSDFL